MRVAAVLGGAVSLLFVVGVGTVLVQANGGDDAGPTDDAVVAGPNDLAHPLWRTPALPEGDSDVLSSVTDGQIWLADGVVVALSGDGAWGHDRETGQRLWRLAQPGGGVLAPCAASPDVNDAGVGAVLYRKGGRCSALAAVDAVNGAVLWHADLTASSWGGGAGEIGRQEDPSLTVGEGVVAVDLGAATHVRRYAVDSGEALPAPEGCEDADQADQQEEQEGRGDLGGADFTTDHTAEYIVTFADCDRDGQREMTLFDTESGARLWSQPADPVPGGEDGDGNGDGDGDGDGEGNAFTLVAGDPLTFAVHGGAADDDVLRTYDEDGGVLGEIPLGDAESASVGSTTYHVTPALVITRSGNDGGIARHRGYDPATGEELWVSELSSRWRLVGEADEEPLVSYEVTDGQGVTFAHVARLDPVNGALRDHAVLAPDPEMTCCPPRPRDAVWSNARDTLYAMEWHVADGLRLVALRLRP